MSTKPHWSRIISEPVEISISPLPINWSAPDASRIVLESILDNTLNAILAGKLAFIIPVITLTEGR